MQELSAPLWPAPSAKEKETRYVLLTQTCQPTEILQDIQVSGAEDNRGGNSYAALNTMKRALDKHMAF